MAAIWLQPKNVGEISLWVTPSQQNHWYWKQMISFLIWKARELKLSKLQYTVSKENIASNMLIRNFW